MAILAASKQNKFWEMYELINEENKLISKIDIFNFALDIHLDINQFKKDFNSEQIINEIEESYNFLRSKGIDATPTVLINGQLVHNSKSITEIEKLINSELKKIK
jgi:predicted DsbA family dithiol-disulfide isomerase